MPYSKRIMAPSTTHSPAKTLSRSEYLAVSWTFTSFAILLSFGRFVIRKRLLGKLQMDDWSHAFALVLLIPYMALSTTIYPLAIEVGLFGKKDGPMPSKETLERFFRLEVAGQLFFWIILYAVKFTFLILFRQIFSVNKIFMRWWWAVFIYTCIAFWACFLEVFWICGSPSDIFVLKKCLTPHASGVVNNFAEVGLALNISSDLAVMILPTCFLRGLQMQLGKKIAVGLLFSVGMVVVVIDAVRLAVGDGGGVVSQALLYDALEPAIAVIMSCLPTYRTLISPARGSSRNLKGDRYQYESGSQQSWKDRITARYRSEGYELSNDSEALTRPPATLPLGKV